MEGLVNCCPSYRNESWTELVHNSIIIMYIYIYISISYNYIYYNFIIYSSTIPQLLLPVPAIIWLDHRGFVWNGLMKHQSPPCLHKLLHEPPRRSRRAERKWEELGNHDWKCYVTTWWNWCGSSVDKEENCLAVTLRCLVHEEYCLTAKLDSVEMFSSDLYSGTEPFAIGTPNAPGAHVDLQSKKYQPHPPCSDHMLAPHELCSLAVLVSACWS